MSVYRTIGPLVYFCMGLGLVKRVGLLLGQSYQLFLMINKSTRGQQGQP